MNTIRITKTITTIFGFIVIVSMFMACDNERGMMYGNSSMGMNNWNWIEIIISLGIGLLIGLLIGFLFGSEVFKKK